MAAGLACVVFAPRSSIAPIPTAIPPTRSVESHLHDLDQNHYTIWSKIRITPSTEPPQTIDYLLLGSAGLYVIAEHRPALPPDSSPSFSIHNEAIHTEGASFSTANIDRVRRHADAVTKLINERCGQRPNATPTVLLRGWTCDHEPRPVEFGVLIGEPARLVEAINAAPRRLQPEQIKLWSEAINRSLQEA